MKACFTCLTLIGLAVWTVGCGSADTDSAATPAADTSTQLGSPGGLDAAPGGIEAGSTTGGITEDTTDESAAGDTTSEEADETTGGPALPEPGNE